MGSFLMFFGIALMLILTKTGVCGIIDRVYATVAYCSLKGGFDYEKVFFHDSIFFSSNVTSSICFC